MEEFDKISLIALTDYLTFNGMMSCEKLGTFDVPSLISTYQHTINKVLIRQLSVRVRYHEQVSPVCLPPADRVLKPGTVCTVIGWGKRDDKERKCVY